MKKIKTKDYKITSKVKLSKIPTLVDLGKKDDLEEELSDTSKKIAKIQDTMYAYNKYSVLICFQGMDTSGKDSLIREVFKEFNVRGVVVSSFKTPNSFEIEHDYLWRHYLALPERGKFAVFNRSHYENVLVTRVHPEYLLNENLPDIKEVSDVGQKFWDMRFKDINNFEKHVVNSGTIILKFFMHLGKEEQRQRLLRRLEEEKHNWKFSPGDLKERERWDDYQKCYEEAINETSTDYAPWYIIPADDKDSARLIVANIILDEMEKYNDIQEPELDDEVKENIKMYKDVLSSEK